MSMVGYVSYSRPLSADFVFIAIGNTPNTHFIAEADPSALSKERTINVNEYLQVRASPPCGPKVG